jgi:indoleamine 2,3-dioxygenase
MSFLILCLLGSLYLREIVSNMPLLDPSGLTTVPQIERAMILLSYIAHAYVWCDADGSGVSPSTTNVLPACIAVPWYQISKKLGRVPALHFATIVQNWRLLDESKPIELGNVVMNQNFYGGIDEEWFFLIPIAMESKGGGIIDAIGTFHDTDILFSSNQSRSIRPTCCRF